MKHDADSHPSEARLVAYLDGELSPEEGRRLSRHVEDCRACGRRMDELRETARVFSEAVADLLPPRSDVTAGDLRRRAEGRGEEADVVGHVGDARESEGSGFRWTTATRIAASVAVLLGAAAALPGSPVRSWIDRSVQGVQALFTADEEGTATESTEPSPSARPEIADRSGVAVGASDGSIRIQLSDVPPSTVVRVRLVDAPQAGVWNAGGRYRTAPGRIEVTAPTSEALLVEIPRSVDRVRLEVNGRVAAVKRSEVLDVRVPGAELRNGEFTFRPTESR